MRVAVVGGGVAGLSTAWHLVELWKASPQAGPLALTFYTSLAPGVGDGSGLGGKAASRSFTGPVDTLRNGLPRAPIYGPMMPWKGTVPHGYHVFWQYPNLRRMLGDEGDGMGLLRPPPQGETPGGSGLIASFQANLDDPSPGGPGVALVGLVDPARPSTAHSPVSQAIFRLQKHRIIRGITTVFRRLFGGVTGLDPLVFTDLFYTREMDLELRLALIGASIDARRTNPERKNIRLDGKTLPLTMVEYDRYTQARLTQWAGSLKPVLAWIDRFWAPFRSLIAVAEGRIEADDPAVKWGRLLLPDAMEDDALLVLLETDRILRELPGAVARLLTGAYPVWRTHHFRFGPDGTFASPYSFDAASAVRSIAFCFLNPSAGRAWTPDGGQIHRVWVRCWQRLKDAVAADPRIQLEIIEGRVLSITEDGKEVGLQCAAHSGHGSDDLGMPHVPDLRHELPLPAGTSLSQYPVSKVDRCVLAIPPGLAEGLLQGDTLAGARSQLTPLRTKLNITLELMLWLEEPIAWAPPVQEALRASCITGLEGAFCLLADYRCGLWSADALAQEHPFGEDKPFSGSILESCGGFEDLYACPSREDAYGWPEATKQVIRDLLSKPEFFENTQHRPWPHDDAGWVDKRADGTWTSARATSKEAADDWTIAARWLVWGYVRQLSLIRSLGPQAVRQLRRYAELLDPRRKSRGEILSPPESLTRQLRYVVMRAPKQRNRIFSPGLGDWDLRPVSGLPLNGSQRVFPAGDWTRNGLDITCMEAACLSGMRAARAVFSSDGAGIPPSAPSPIPVMPPASWYSGTDPHSRGRP